MSRKEVNVTLKCKKNQREFNLTQNECLCNFTKLQNFRTFWANSGLHECPADVKLISLL